MMTNTTPRRTNVRFAAVLVPLASLLAGAACSSTSSTDGPGNPTGGVGGIGTGGSIMTGGSFAAAGTPPSAGAPAVAGAATNGGSPAGGSGTSGAPANGGGGASGTPGTGGSAAGSGGVAMAGSAGSAGATAGSGGTTASAGAGGAGGGKAGSGGAATGGGGGSAEAVLHVFMLMGQSNMAGVAKRQASDSNSDARIKVFGGCNQPAGQWNTVTNPPLNECPGEKGWNLSDTVDPGIWFAKTLLPKLPAGHSIGLVGTAESGESINTFISGGSHHQMILNKIAKAKTTPNARFAGVIFHQGESDTGQSTWPDKVVQLYREVKTAWGVSYDVPFILGELPAGGCCSSHNNLVRQAADKLPMGEWISQDGTMVMDEYHFDHASVVLMGKRYGEKMIEALKW